MGKYWISAGHSAKSELKKTAKKRPCQDSIHILSDEGENFVCISVADGAGSAFLSHLGANAVTKGICKLLRKKFSEFYDADPFIVKRIIIHSLRTSLGKIAKKNNAIIRDFASTLLFVCIRDEKIIVGHLGDGLILYKKDGEMKILSEPENGEFLNQTYFVTSPHYSHHLRLYKGTIEEITGFYLMTDGIASGSNYNRKTKKIAGRFIELMSNLSNKSDFALQSQILNFMKTNIVNKTADDSTLGVMVLNESC